MVGLFLSYGSRSFTSSLSKGAVRKLVEQAPVACVFRGLESTEQSALPQPLKIPRLCLLWCSGGCLKVCGASCPHRSS